MDLAARLVVPKRDHYVCKIGFKWTPEQFRTIMKLAQFERVEKNGQLLYKRRLPTEEKDKFCTLVAYETGTIQILNGSSRRQIKLLINKFLNNKLNPDKETYINFTKNINFTYWRCLIELRLPIDIDSLTKHLNLKPRTLQQQKAIQKGQIQIPESIHLHRNVEVYLSRTGTIEIRRANLVKQMNNLVKSIFNNLITDFVVLDRGEREGNGAVKMERLMVSPRQYQFVEEME